MPAILSTLKNLIVVTIININNTITNINEIPYNLKPKNTIGH